MKVTSLRAGLLVLALWLVAAQGAGAQGASAPMHRILGSAAALPQTQLHFGLTSSPADLAWMTSSGVPWRYRYQYLAGGVNTTTGWETWNSPTGAFASLYMNASSGAGYIPVFTYYELLQSTPSSGANESDRDYNNLNNTATMSAYYANFKLLMQKAGAFANPVVVHVEPDLWGYLQQRAAGGTASTVSASVASSGFADVAGIPNTAQGFGEALLKLRDLYGSNAILAIHASGWASGTDINSDTRSSVSAVTVADSTAAFLNSAGLASNPFGSTWDLVFNDPDDHDAGWWEKQGANNASFTHWWDPTNTTFPNFTRYLAWVAELKVKTARPQVAWQVPVGNQYFLTMNNTCGHYQDNVAPYFINNASSLYAAGLIAVLFGAGNACQTGYTDAQHDGVTNNGGLTTTDAAGYCNACNTHVSSAADDDGGYLRLFVGLYYGGWQSLGGTLTSRPAVSSWGATRTDTFVRGSDNGLWHRSWNGTAWSAWDTLGGTLTADPSAVSEGPNQIDVFVRGTDNGIWHRAWNGSLWSAWDSVGGVATSGPAAGSWGVGRLDLVVRGTDNALWHRSWNGSGWGAWDAVGGAATSNPSVVAWGAGRLDVFVRGTDNALWHRSGDGAGTWNAWDRLGGTLASAPSASSCATGHLDAFVLGTDHALYQLGYNGAWGAWRPVGGQWTSDPGAVCQPATTTVDLVERGTDFALWHTTTTGS